LLLRGMAGSVVCGTSRRAALPGIAVGGKTGTAQVPKAGGKMDHITWFTSMGSVNPVESPEYVVVAMVESGASGGTICAPIAARIYRHLQQRAHSPTETANSLTQAP
ncbi:MAG TPA: penicillin-binding transpeptidase domain-containing protein, partial [Methylomirabilota bacterium]|nr:penicillin-binding transpeptidase domain-containing protein [Methylomirabilota bacterium]